MKNNGFGSAGLGGGGNYIRLKDDGDSSTFYVPQGSEITERYQLWEGGKSKDVDSGIEGATLKYSVKVMEIGADGKATPKTLEAGNSLFKKFRAAVEKIDGTLYSHVFNVERIGEKGDKATQYRFVSKGLAPKPVVLTEAEIAAKDAAAEKVANAIFAAEGVIT